MDKTEIARVGGTAEGKAKLPPSEGYEELVVGVVKLIEQGRLAAAKSVNFVLTSTYWLVGRRIVQHEQKGSKRAGYGEEVLKRLSRDLTSRLGRGFSHRNLDQMRQFYLNWPIPQTASANSEAGSISQTLSAKSEGWPAFPLPWSHYVRLLSVTDAEARRFYEREAVRSGWSEEVQVARGKAFESVSVAQPLSSLVGLLIASPSLPA